MLARATAPLKPPIEMFKMSASAFASLSETACTVMDVECSMVPPRLAVVWPETSAIGAMTAIATPPTTPPGAVAVAWLADEAETSTAPELVLTSLLEVVFASVSRWFSARATVTPTAPAPVATLMVFDETLWKELAVTL